jgi:hypothetical protein
MFGGQAVFLVLVSSPALLIDSHATVMFLLLLRTLCNFTALFLLTIGLLSKQLAPGGGLGPLDHCLAFMLLQLGCSIALHLIG